MKNLLNLTYEELSDCLNNIGMQSFRAKQIFQWVFQKGVFDFNNMSNISKKHREVLTKNFNINFPEIVTRIESIDGTEKFALKLSDGNIVESVIIPDEKRMTLCISTQAGCRMGCKFCHTATLGFKRNLLTSEIIAQILIAQFKILKNKKITNLVFMGMGEPLDNYENLKKSLQIIYNEFGLNYSYRKVTVSTVGIIEKMMQLGNDFDINLAVSLHAANNEVRSSLMPVNKKFPLNSLIEACKKFPVKNRQRITFEYILINNVNDSINDAKNLLKILSNVKGKVNLIKFNPFPGCKYTPSTNENIKKFQEYLNKKGLTAILRKSKGEDILAACGQLSGKLKRKEYDYE